MSISNFKIILRPEDVLNVCAYFYLTEVFAFETRNLSFRTFVSAETTVRFHKSNPEAYIITIFDVNFGME